jgi:putative hydrolase of the HAD superfamily
MKQSSRLELVIFDLDGLLVDSESLQFEAYHEVFANYDVALELSDWPEWHRLEASAARWIEAHDLPLDPEKIRSEKKLIYEQLIEEKLNLKPGARLLVEELSKCCRLCVASGSRPESIRACLDKFSLTPHFEQLFSATLLSRKKPYPDVYLQALEIMQVKTANAIAIEDSVSGLKASVAAGIQCVVCPDNFYQYPASAFEGAAMMIDSLRDLDFTSLEKLLSLTA